jgi:hypothetical protein
MTIDALSLIRDRRFGEMRVVFVSEMTGDLGRVLGKCGLLPDASRLSEFSKELTQKILVKLLARDMAYGSECIPIETAAVRAQELIDESSTLESRFYSNGNWSEASAWNPLTESTFDGGILMTIDQFHYLCIWFQDED